MTPNYGYDPSDPRAQPQQGQRQPPRQPPQQGGQPPQQPLPQQGQPRQPPRQPPQQGAPPGQPQPPRTQAAGQQTPPPTGQAGPPGGAAQPQPPAGGPGAPGTQLQPGRRGAGRQPVVLEPVTADDVVTEDVITVQPDTPVRTAVAEMAEEDVGSVVVVEDDEPVGVVTDRKVALALEEQPDVAQRSVDELTQDDLETVGPETTIYEALQTMSDHGIRRLPVVDESGKLQGILTLDDAIVLIGGELGHVADTVQSQIENL